MAKNELRVYKVKSGRYKGLYTYEFYAPKRIRSTGYKTATQARIAGKKAMEDYVPPTDITFKYACETYLKSKDKRIKDNSYRNISSIIKNNILPYFENQIITTLTSKDIFQWQNSLLDKGLAPYSINKHFRLLKRIYRYNIKLYNLETNSDPFENVETLKFVTKEKFNYVSIFEFHTLLENHTIARQYVWMVFSFYSGLRPGESLGLQIKKLNFKNNTVKVDATLTKDKKSKVILGDSPKTDSSYRIVPIPQFVMDLLKLQIDELKKYGPVNDNTFVFGTTGKQWLNHSAVASKLHKLCVECNIKDITPHALRHSYATHLLENGVSVTKVSKRLGHKKITETYNTYSHVIEGISKDDIDVFEKTAK